jgi:nitrate reductase gamma subunit
MDGSTEVGGTRLFRTPAWNLGLATVAFALCFAAWSLISPFAKEGAPFIFQAHAFTAWLLLGIWPFTRLVHAWSVPVAYLRRAPILYRSRAAATRPSS